jgi:hypothetical protein
MSRPRSQHRENKVTDIPDGSTYTEQNKMAVTREWISGWNACRALLSAAPVEPVGWKIVPIEPTEEMCRAIPESAQDDPILDAAATYRAMLAAAPLSPAPLEQQNPSCARGPGALTQPAISEAPRWTEGWISADDALPDYGVEVLLFRPDAHKSQDPIYTLSQRRRGDHGGPFGFECVAVPTHWMFLPPDPIDFAWMRDASAKSDDAISQEGFELPDAGSQPAITQADARRTALNNVCIDGHLNAALDAIMRSHSPDEQFNILGSLAQASIDCAFAALASGRVRDASAKSPDSHSQKGVSLNTPNNGFSVLSDSGEQE